MQNEPDVDQLVDREDGTLVSVYRNGLKPVYEAAKREYHNLNSTNALSQTEAVVLSDALDAVSSVLESTDSEQVFQTVAVSQRHLGVVFRTAYNHAEGTTGDIPNGDISEMVSGSESLCIGLAVVWETLNRDGTTVNTVYTVDQLVDRWQAGEIGLDDADEIEGRGPESIELTFEGSDGDLILTYSLSADLTYRTDVQGGRPFNIIEE